MQILEKISRVAPEGSKKKKRKITKAFVFTRSNGKRVKDFRTTWEKACEAAGVPGLLFHDLRRTAARNLRRAGVPETIIMKIGGWQTRSVFERYAIVSRTDIADAMRKLQQSEKLQEKKENRQD